MPRDSRFDILFEPVKIGPVTAPNRFYQVPHCTGMGYQLPATLAAMRGVKGFAGYTLARSSDGGFSVTSCQDKSSADETARVAKDWIAKNAANIAANPPMVCEGAVILQM